MDSDYIASQESLLNSIIDMAIEAWRFGKVFEKAMQKLDVLDQKKYISQYQWFFKKVTSSLDNAGLRIVNVEGQIYDIGMAVTPINLDEFSEKDTLIVEQMLEPIIMNSNSVVKTGTVLLKRREGCL